MPDRLTDDELRLILEPGPLVLLGDPRELVVELLEARARITELESGAKLMGTAIAEYNAIALAATSTVPDLERGDGTTGYVDWQGVWEKVAELRPNLDAANATVAAMSRELDAVYALTQPPHGDYEHDHGEGDGHDGCPACWAADILTALGENHAP